MAYWIFYEFGENSMNNIIYLEPYLRNKGAPYVYRRSLSLEELILLNRIEKIFTACNRAIIDENKTIKRLNQWYNYLLLGPIRKFFIYKAEARIVDYNRMIKEVEKEKKLLMGEQA